MPLSVSLYAKAGLSGSKRTVFSFARWCDCVPPALLGGMLGVSCVLVLVLPLDTSALSQFFVSSVALAPFCPWSNIKSLDTTGLCVRMCVCAKERERERGRERENVFVCHGVFFWYVYDSLCNFL